MNFKAEIKVAKQDSYGKSSITKYTETLWDQFILCCDEVNSKNVLVEQFLFMSLFCKCLTATYAVYHPENNGIIIQTVVK